VKKTKTTGVGFRTPREVNIVALIKKGLTSPKNSEGGQKKPYFEDMVERCNEGKRGKYCVASQ